MFFLTIFLVLGTSDLHKHLALQGIHVKINRVRQSIPDKSAKKGVGGVGGLGGGGLGGGGEYGEDDDDE